MKNPSVLRPALRSEIARSHGSSFVKNTLLVCATVLLAIATILHPLVGNAVARENGPIEVLQFALLAAGFLMLAWQSIRSSLDKPGLFLFSLLFLTLALRELDLRQSAAPDWLVQITLHQRHLWLTPLWLAAIGYAVLRRAEIRRWARGLDWSILKPLGALTVGVYLVSFSFEKHLVVPKGALATFWEETAELLLAVSMVAFARALSRHQEVEVAQPDYAVVRSLN